MGIPGVYPHSTTQGAATVRRAAKVDISQPGIVDALRKVRRRAPNGAGAINGNGYRATMIDSRLIPDHIRIAERALGKRLPKGAEVHHVNEIKTDNRNANLVICPNGAYHQMLHRRARAYDACGHADWRKCSGCGWYHDPSTMVIKGSNWYRDDCYRAYEKARAIRRRQCAVLQK